MHRNQFAPLKEEAGSPMSSVISVTPTELGASVELAKPDKEWMNLQSWTLPPDVQSLDARSEFDRCESTLLKAESDLGFDVGMAAMRPADVLRSTAHIAEESTGYPFSDPGGWVVFTQILSQLVDRRQEFAGARTVYLIVVDSRLPNLVDYWPAFQPWWTSREQIFGPHKEVTRLVWEPCQCRKRRSACTALGRSLCIASCPVFVSNHSHCKWIRTVYQSHSSIEFWVLLAGLLSVH